MKPITVEQLKKLCESEIKKGNGKKVIMISEDDEGNGYHYLWYQFSSPEDAGLSKIEVCEEIAEYENTIILG